MLAVALTGATAFLDMYATQPLLPEFLRTFGTDKATAGLTVTALTTGVALAAVPTGFISELIGRKRIIVTAMFLLTACTAAAALSPGIGGLIGWRFVQGLVMPGVLALTVAYISEEFPAGEAPAAFAAYTSGGILGGFAGRFVTAFAADAYDWRVAFWLLGAANLAGALLVTLLLPKSRAFVRSSGLAVSLADARAHLRNTRFLATCVLGGNALMSLVAVYTFITYHLSAAPYNLRTAQLGNVFFLYLVGAVFTLRGSRLISRYGNRLVILVAAGGAIAGAAIMLVPSLYAVLAGLLILTCAVFITQTAAQGNIRNVISHGTAIAAAFYLVSYYILGGLGAVVPALIAPGAAWPAALGTVAGLQVLSIAIILLFVRRAARAGEPLFPVY